MENAYFTVLPKSVQWALGKAAYDTFLNHPPAFAFSGKWEDVRPDMKERWLAVVRAIMNALQDQQEFVTTDLMEYNERQRVLADAVERFENWKPDEAYHNNYQQLAQLISLHAEVVNAQLLINRSDFEHGNFQVTGIETTKKVFIPNVGTSE